MYGFSRQLVQRALRAGMNRLRRRLRYYGVSNG